MAFWDFLRPIITQAIAYDFLVRVAVFIISVVILAIALLAYKRTKTNRLLFVSIAFFFFVAKLGLKVVDLYLSPGEFFHRAAENVFELIILASLFIALFRK